MDIEKLITVPEGYLRVQKLENDPEGCVNMGKETPSAQCFVQIFPIAKEKAMHFDAPQEVIDGLHGAVAENQALVEVKNGKTAAGRPFIYSIVKTKMDPSGVQYFLLLQVLGDDGVANVQGFFTEDGMTGMRDAMVWSQCRRDGLISDDDPTQWFSDPYDPDLRRSFLMNRSEREEYDVKFPEHPLSQCRDFIRAVIG